MGQVVWGGGGAMGRLVVIFSFFKNKICVASYTHMIGMFRYIYLHAFGATHL